MWPGVRGEKYSRRKCDAISLGTQKRMKVWSNVCCDRKMFGCDVNAWGQRKCLSNYFLAALAESTPTFICLTNLFNVNLESSLTNFLTKRDYQARWSENIFALHLTISMFRFDARQSPSRGSKLTFPFICFFADNLQRSIKPGHPLGNLTSLKTSLKHRARISFFQPSCSFIVM